jgi:saccharopine dehydrogenase (NADP+, L-glutamate forming)
VRVITETHKRGAKIRSFLSYVGGLPSPEASDNPLGYKFSWSPRGVLLAARNDAKFYKDGKVVSIPGSDLMNNAKPWLIYPGFAFYGYPNRDSTPYKERYQIPEAENLLRGSLRYQGNPSFVQTLNDLGFLSDEKIPELSEPIPWAEATKHVIKAASSSAKDLEAAIQSRTKFPSADDQSRILAGLRWVGLFSATEKITPRGTPLDILCASLEKKCAYGPDERDMVMLQHKFEIENPDGSVEWRTSTLIEFGNPKGYSAMSYLVGIPCSCAIKCVLSGAISDKGILAPLNAKINEPITKQLEEYKIRFVEKTLA